MVRHIVWWTLKDEADGHTAAENIDRIKEGSLLLNGIPGVRSVEVSADIQPTTTVQAQLVLTTTHDSLDDLKTYAEDPVHLDFAQIIKAVSASRSCLDFIFED